MAILENGYRKTQFSWDFVVVLNWAKRFKKLSNGRPTHVIAKCTLTGLVQKTKKSIGSEIWSCAYVFSTPLLLPSTATHAGWNSKCRCHQQKKQKTPACTREIPVHKHWTKVYSQQGLTAMMCLPKGAYLCHCQYVQAGSGGQLCACV